LRGCDRRDAGKPVEKNWRALTRSLVTSMRCAHGILFHRLRAIAAKLWLTNLALVFLVVSVPAAATLGEDAASVRVDQTQTKMQMQGTLQVRSAAKSAAYEIHMPSATVVKAYVSPPLSWRATEDR